MHLFGMCVSVLRCRPSMDLGSPVYQGNGGGGGHDHDTDLCPYVDTYRCKCPIGRLEIAST